MKLLDWLLDRFSENSTWRGAIALLTAAGVTLQPDMANAIIAVGLGVIGIINVLRQAP